MTDTYDAISLESIRTCSRALSDVIVRTPVLQWLEGNRRNGEAPDVWLKLELFQHTGTFKARGALNAVRHLDSTARSRGITAVSAGNHAIAAAFAARECGTTAKVVMIRTANEARIRRARSYGAEILFADDGRSAFAMAEEISRVEGRAMIHPFEGPYVAQGAGTLGLEFVEQAGDLDAAIIAIGGGGLCGGGSCRNQAVPASLQGVRSGA